MGTSLVYKNVTMPWTYELDLEARGYVNSAGITAHFRVFPDEYASWCSANCYQDLWTDENNVVHRVPCTATQLEACFVIAGSTGRYYRIDINGLRWHTNEVLSDDARSFYGPNGSGVEFADQVVEDAFYECTTETCFHCQNMIVQGPRLWSRLGELGWYCPE